MASENSPADTVTRTAETGSGRLTSRLRAILAIVLIADVLDLMDSTITNIAAPSIVRDIGGGESLIKWLGAGYALAMGVLLVVGGRLGDRYGKRRMFLIGIAGFTTASLVSGLAADPAMLITARVFQGGLGAVLIPPGDRDPHHHVLTRADPDGGQPVRSGDGRLGDPRTDRRRLHHQRQHRRARWRPIFLINIILGSIGFIDVFRILPHDAGERRRDHRRPRGGTARPDDARDAVRIDHRLDRRLDRSTDRRPGPRRPAADRVRSQPA